MIAGPAFPRSYDELISRERPEPGEWHVHVPVRDEPRRDCIRCRWPVTTAWPHTWCFGAAAATAAGESTTNSKEA